MPFLAPAVGLLGTAIGSVSAWIAASPILAGIVQTAFGIALKYAVNALFPPKQPSSASKLETEYGANLARSVVLGTCGVAGQHIFRAATGKGNRRIWDVHVLSNFRITSVPRVRYKGEWVTLPAPNGEGWRVVPGSDGDVKIRIYSGTMTQTADTELIGVSKGRWTVNHRGAGVAYAIVWTRLLQDRLTSPWQPFFEVVGAPLYDWRFDTTAGGSGSQRYTDQNTWVYSDNPTVQTYNLERGIFNGTELMVGKRIAAGRLPLSEYTLAANICDEAMSDGTKRYRSHLIATSGPESTHANNITPLLEAMAGAWVERVDGEYPIAGAPQSIVATITDDDLAQGAPVKFSLYRPRIELINTVASSYISPVAFYEAIPGTTRIDAAALAADGERLASSIPYAAVTESKQVDRLADIAMRGARYQASADITIHPRFLDTVKIGKWIRWNSVKYGNYVYQVLSRLLGPLDSTGCRDITLSLQRIDNGVFDPSAYTTAPPVVPVVPTPEYLAEVADFTVTPNIVVGDNGEELPGARLQWTPVDDVTVAGVDIQYWPLNDPTQVFNTYAPTGVSVFQIVDGLTSNTDWVVRTRLRIFDTVNRPVAWGGNYPFHTLTVSGMPPVDWEALGDDIKNYFEWITDDVRELIRQAEEQATWTSDNHNVMYSDIQTIRRELTSTTGLVTAGYTEAILVATGPTSALAQSITSLNAQINAANGDIAGLASSVTVLQTTVTTQAGQITAVANSVSSLDTSVGKFSANGKFRTTVESTPAGASARIGLSVAASDGASTNSASLFLDALTGGTSRIVGVASQFIITDSSYAITVPPFVVTGGVVRMNVANIGTVTAGILQSADGKVVFNLNNKTLIFAD